MTKVLTLLAVLFTLLLALPGAALAQDAGSGEYGDPELPEQVDPPAGGGGGGGGNTPAPAPAPTPTPTPTPTPDASAPSTEVAPTPAPTDPSATAAVDPAVAGAATTAAGETLPRTGLDAPWVALGGLLLLLAGVGLRRHPAVARAG